MEINRRDFLKASVLSALQLGVIHASIGASYEPVFKSGLPRMSPEKLGVSSQAILNFVNAVNESNIHSLMIVKKGHVIAEGWWAPYAPHLKHTLYSLSKSFTSTAIGFAVQEKLLSVNDKVTSFFPDKLPEVISDNLSKMTIKNLLSMATGHKKDTTFTMIAAPDGDWIKSFFTHPVEVEPGTLFVYNSGATYMLSAILQKVTGQSLLEYLRPRLFDPLEIEDADWEVDPNGIAVGGWGLRIKTEDIAKFGLLYLQKGTWKGKPLISPDWISEATTAHILQPGTEENRSNSDWHQGYGYQFWRCRHNAFRGDGAYGQYCLVIPEHDLVVAITSETADMAAIQNEVWKYLIEPSNPLKSSAPLTQKLMKLALPLPQGNVTSPLNKSVNTTAYKLENNPLGIQQLAIRFSKNGGELALNNQKGKHTFPFGLSEWKQGKSKFAIEWLKLIPSQIPSDPELFTASSAYWISPTTLQITCRFIDTAHYMIVQLGFENSNIQVDFIKSTTAISNKMDPTYTIKGSSV